MIVVEMRVFIFVMQPVTWASLALLAATGVGLILFWDREKKRQLEGWLSFSGCLNYSFKHLICGMRVM